MEIHYQNQSMPYNSIGSFVDFFGGLTYEHVNYIFAEADYAQVVIKYFLAARYRGEFLLEMFYFLPFWARGSRDLVNANSRCLHLSAIWPSMVFRLY